MRDFKPLLLAIIMALCLVYTAQAQETHYFSDYGTLTITPDSVSYDMGHRSAAFPNLALAELPRMNQYQYVSHDLALLVDDIERSGVEVRTPPNPQVDSLRAVADSLYTEVLNLLTENSQLATTISEQTGQIASLEADLAEAQAALEPVQAELDSLRAEEAYAIGRMREIMDVIRNR